MANRIGVKIQYGQDRFLAGEEHRQRGLIPLTILDVADGLAPCWCYSPPRGPGNNGLRDWAVNGESFFLNDNRCGESEEPTPIKFNEWPIAG
jgi:hypothetical protein